MFVSTRWAEHFRNCWAAGIFIHPALEFTSKRGNIILQHSAAVRTWHIRDRRHGSILPCTNNSGCWWYNSVEDVVLARFGPHNTNWASFKHHMSSLTQCTLIDYFLLDNTPYQNACIISYTLYWDRCSQASIVTRCGVQSALNSLIRLNLMKPSESQLTANWINQRLINRLDFQAWRRFAFSLFC